MNAAIVSLLVIVGALAAMQTGAFPAPSVISFFSYIIPLNMKLKIHPSQERSLENVVWQK